MGILLSVLLWLPVSGSTSFATHSAGRDITVSSHGALWQFPAARVEMTLPGSRDVAGAGLNESRINNVTGNDPAQWTSEKVFGRVRYPDVYPGISLDYHSHGRDLEFDFLVAPGADWQRIAIAFPGTQKITLDQQGNANTSGITLHRPRVLQAGRVLDARYVLARGNGLKLKIDGVDPNAAMLIDPVIVFATYYGGEDIDNAEGIATDNSGNTYVTGFTASAQLPLRAAIQGARGGVSKTTNGAAAWSGSSQGITNADVQSVAIASDGTLYAASFAGVFKSGDSGATWTSATSGLASYYVSGVAVAPNNASTIYASTRAATGGGVYVSTNAGATWTLAGLAGVDMVFVAIDPASGAILAGSQAASGPDGALYRSPDGINWTIVDRNFVRSVAFDPQTPGTIYAAFSDLAQGVAKSTDSGVTWTMANSGTVGVAPDAIAAGPGVLYAGGNSFLAKSVDGGKTWTTLSVPLTGSFKTLLVDPVTPSNVYAGFEQGVLKSTDAGATWTVARTGLVSYNVYQLTIDPRNPSQIYAATRVLSKAFVSKYDSSGNLVYSTYFGGAGPDGGMAIAVDAVQNVYFCGLTASPDFPTTPGAFQTVLGATSRTAYLNAPPTSVGFPAGGSDAFAVKLDANGKVIYSTLLGGTGDDIANSIAVDGSGNAVLVGTTAVADFPVQNAFQSAIKGSSNAFISKLNSTGTALIFSTYLGASQDLGNGVAVDGSGNAWVTGSTNFESTFPQLNPLPASSLGPNPQSGFVAKFNPAGTLLYSTLFLTGRGIATDAAGNAYVAGFGSQGFPLVHPAQTTGHNFLVKLSPDGGTVIYATALAGSQGGGIAVGVDSAGGAYVAGTVFSNDVPLVNPLQSTYNRVFDGFIAAVDPTGSHNVYSTYFGGTGDNWLNAIAVDALGTAYVAGYSDSSGFPATNAAQAQLGGYIDAIVAKISQTPGSGPTLNASIGGVQSAAASATAPAGPAGSLISIYGAGLSATTASAPAVPLPTTLAGVTVTMSGTAIPLLYVSATQINAQIPWSLAGTASAIMTVTNLGGSSNSFNVALQTALPEIFPVSSGGTTYAAALIANTSILAAPTGAFPGSRPAHPGEYVEVFCTGLGAVSNPPATGAAPPSTPLSSTVSTVTASIGGVPAPVSFAGLAPGFVGLYQVNLQVPASAPSGTQNVSISIGGQTATLPIAVGN